ncbi:NAD(P)/FAD-dependent oxidoreductase [Seongchinamella unica]|uniref:NAD(P)/FAD-dependent oxidoreductase n=1 Tax=Seongchinamella unica TaxID=2547392 RepID=A0A4R5LWQ8_9GAMM|nr:FAD-dependent oxidoreductase [Seongchinamella unica]TDG15929.1 NAD(P)/FAD-dependent oxidoreductase [Seongchinamella unica]
MSPETLIIGAGMATAYLLQELENRGHDGDITVIGDERDCCYNRVLLSSLLAGETAEEALRLLPADQGRATRFIAGTRVEKVDTQNRLVRCDNGHEQHYDQLVFATGSSVAKPEIAGADVAGVGVFRTLDDTRKLLEVPGENRQVVVIGGGLLGLEAAHGLNQRGHRTTVLHRNQWLMNRQLDEEGGRVLQRELESQGMNIQLGASASRVHSENNHIIGVELDNGDYLDCQLLLVATGIAPNRQLAAAAGLATDRGIVVDGQLRCSINNVFALGECSQLGEHCFGLVAPIRKQAKVLAGQLTNRPGTDFEIDDWPTQLKISGIDLYRAGVLDTDAEHLVLRDPDHGVYRRLVIRDDQLIGAVLVGDKRGGTWYAELIHNRRNIAALRHGLMFGPEMAQTLAPATAA